jgi:hypothetical protein
MPFTVEQFLNVFATYNQAIYPLQWVLTMLAMAAVFLALRPKPASGSIIAVLLALLWLWTGIVYHFVFFSRINKAAYLFALLCVVQAAIFLITGVRRRELQFRAKLNRVGLVGGGFIIYALIIYPALSHLFGHGYPQSPTFGAPCPTTIFTFGLLLWIDRRLSPFIIAIPFVWSLLGFTAALSFGIGEDLGLFVAGGLGTLLIVRRKRDHSLIAATDKRLRLGSRNESRKILSGNAPQRADENPQVRFN